MMHGNTKLKSDDLQVSPISSLAYSPYSLSTTSRMIAHTASISCHPPISDHPQYSLITLYNCTICRTNTVQAANQLQIILFVVLHDVRETVSNMQEGCTDFGLIRATEMGRRDTYYSRTLGLGSNPRKTTLQCVNRDTFCKFWLCWERRYSSVESCLHPYWTRTLRASRIPLVSLQS